TPGRDGCIAIRCTQWPISAVGSGMYCECNPRLIGLHVYSAASLRKAPAEETAVTTRLCLLGHKRIVCRHIPPAPGAHLSPEPCPRRPASSRQVWPPSVERNKAVSSTPA